MSGAKKAFVTGASEGIGRAFVQRLALDGWSTTAVARNEERLRSLVEELGSGEHDYLVADLGTDDGVAVCVERLSAGEYSLLVNNAGYSRFGSFVDADIADERSILAVNCGAVMSLAHAFLREASSGDALINLASLTAYLPTPIQPTYVATKSFLASFSESLWYQQRKRGVYVQGLCPGVTRTRIIERSGEIDHAALLDRLSATPESVVATSLRALKRRRGPIVIPGFGNRLLALTFRIAPRRASVWLLGKVGDLSGIDA